jgi:succinoglycan biosynthesis transport protein ExoP
MAPERPTAGDAADLFADEPGAAINLGQVLQVLRRHWRLLVLAVLLALAGGALQFAITPKEYRASTIIQIERRSLVSLTGSDNPWLENYWNMEYYPTQYRLLQSRGLAERVVRDQRLLDGTSASAAAGASAAADEAAIGGLAAGLLGGLEVNPIAGTQLVEIGYRARDPEKAAQLANAFAEAFIDLGIETRTQTAGKASDFLGSQIATLKQEITDKEAQLQAYGRSTDIVSLDPDSNVVLTRLKALNDDYVSAVSARIEKESRYQAVLQSAPETIAETLTEGPLIGELRAELLKLEREYASKLDTYRPEWPAMAELKSRIDRGRQNLEAQIAAAVEKARGVARADLETAQRRERSLAAQLAQAKSETLTLSSAAVEYSNLQLEISTRRATLDQLMTRQAETEVTSRLQGTRETNVRIVDRALVPGGPFKPNLRRNLSMGFLIGLVFGIGAIVLIEFLDRSVKTPEEVERLLGLPVLAVIPDVAETGRGYGYGSYGYGYGYGYGLRRKRKPKGDAERGPASGPAVAAGAVGAAGAKEGESSGSIELMPHARPRLVASEAYRSLRTALLLSSAEQLRVVAITSSQSGEGKSATATNLAVVMAQLGGRVLLVDGDLRKPRLHDVFKVSNRMGLVNVLAAGAKPDSVFLPTEVPGLFLTPSGPIPPNPSELLASSRMREFVRFVRSQFDFVVIDAPPTLAVTDPTILGTVADGVVLCVRARKVPREDLRSCRDRLRLADIRVLGTVLNRYRDVQGGYGKRYHHYAAYAYEESGDRPAPTRNSAA